MENQIFNIINDMAGILNGAQLKRLQQSNGRQRAP